MKVLACDVDWIIEGGGYSCPGDVYSVQAPESPMAITLDDAKVLSDHALTLFAVVAAFLLVKKAIN